MNRTTGVRQTAPVSLACNGRQHLDCGGDAWDHVKGELGECLCGCHVWERAS